MNRILERPVVRTLSWHEVGLEDGRKGRPYRRRRISAPTPTTAPAMPPAACSQRRIAR